MKKSIKKIFYLFTIIAMVVSTVSCNNNEPFAGVNVDGSDVMSGYPLDPVTLQGTNFDLVQFVFVGDVQAEFQLGDGTLTFVIPESAAIGTTTVTLAMADNYRVTYPFEVLLTPVPIVQGFDKAYAAAGETITITGTSFNAEYNPVVTIGGMEAAITSNTATQLVVTVPSGVSETEYLDVTVTNNFGSGTAPTAFVALHDYLANSQLNEGSGNDFTGWQKLNGGDFMTELTGGDAYGGSGRSLRVEPAGGNPWDRQLASDPVVLELGATYTVIFWAKAEGPGAGMRISVSQYNSYGAGSDYFYSSDMEISASAWTPYTVTFTVTKDLPDHKIVFDMGAYSVPFAIDHMALVPGSFSAVTGPPELLTNGSFEDGLTGWTTLNGSHDISTTEAYCGSQSMTATGAASNPWNTQLASDPMDMVEGTDYEISFWAKAAGPGGIFRISMSQYDGNGSDFFYSPDLDIPEDWTYFSFVVNAAHVPSGEYRLLFDMGATDQTFFLDAVSVKEYEFTGSLVANGGFEDGLTGWTTLNGSHDISTTEFHSGSASMTATGAASNPWNTQLASDPMDMVEGNVYKISFWAKAAGPGGVFRISMSQYDGNGSDFFYGPDLDIPEDWTYYTFIVTAAHVPSGEYRLLFDMGATDQTFFLDDVEVTEYNACE